MDTTPGAGSLRAPEHDCDDSDTRDEDLGIRRVERKIMSALFSVGLIAFEIVNRCSHESPAFLSGQTACTSWPAICSA
jgi:hypothetical protein